MLTLLNKFDKNNKKLDNRLKGEFIYSYNKSNIYICFDMQDIDILFNLDNGLISYFTFKSSEIKSEVNIVNKNIIMLTMENYNYLYNNHILEKTKEQFSLYSYITKKNNKNHVQNNNVFNTCINNSDEEVIEEYKQQYINITEGEENRDFVVYEGLLPINNDNDFLPCIAKVLKLKNKKSCKTTTDFLNSVYNLNSNIDKLTGHKKDCIRCINKMIDYIEKSKN